MTVRAYLYLTGPLAGIISFISLSFISLSMLVYQLGTLWLVYNSSYDCYTWKATPRAVTGIRMWGRLASNSMKSVPVIILWATNTRRKASWPSLLVARSLTWKGRHDCASIFIFDRPMGMAGIIWFISLSFISLSILVYQLGILWLVYNSSYDCYIWKVGLSVVGVY